LVYKFLPPLAANYVLHLALWYTAVIALYYTLKTATSRQVGLIAAVFLGSYLYFLQPVGSDYVDGPANVYLLVCFAFFTGAARSERNSWTLILAGAAYAAAVHTNLFAIILGPVALLYFALLSRRSRGQMPIRAGLVSLAWFLVGAATLTALLGCANFLIEGNFHFYQPSIYFVSVTIGKPNPWKLPLADWIDRAWWLALPTVIAVSSLIAFANRRFRMSLAGPAAASAFLFACLLMILCEWRGLPVLQYSYYASYLIPTMFLVIGVLLANSIERLKDSSVILVAIGVLLVNSVPLWGYGALLAIRTEVRLVLLILFAALFMICALVKAGMAPWGMVVALIVCHLVSVGGEYAFEDRHAAREAFARISRAADAVDSVRQGEPIRFWYRKSDSYFSDFNALNSMYLWRYTMFGDNFPEIAPWAMYGPGSLVAILSSQGDHLAEANEALKEKALAAEFVESRLVNDGSGRYSLTFIRVVYDYSQLQPQALQACRGENCRNLIAASSQENLPLGGWLACENGDRLSSMERKADGIHITTVSTRFGKAAKYGPLIPAASGRYLFRLTYGLFSGNISFTALSEDESQRLALAPMPAAQRARQTALLSLNAEAGKPFWLMTANNHPVGDHASSYVIRELEAYWFPVEEAVMGDQSPE
jgi:hypothetical protein